jgi:hypothetical protein
MKNVLIAILIIGLFLLPVIGVFTKRPLACILFSIIIASPLCGEVFPFNTASVYLILLAIPFAPALIVWFLVREKTKTPYLLQIVLMASGLIFTRICMYFGLSHSPNIQAGDKILASAIIWIVLMYFLFKNSVLPWQAYASSISISGLFLSAYVVISTVAGSGVGGLVKYRMGMAPGVDVNSNELASLLDLTLPFAAWLGFAENGVKRSIALASLLIQFVAVLLTLTRGSLPAVGLLIIYCLYVYRRNKIVRWIQIGVVIAGVVCLGGVFATRLTAANGTGDFTSNWGRLALLKASFDVLKEQHYIMGIGFDNFKIIKYSHGFPFLFDHGKGYSSHNAHLEIWLGWGLLALIGWELLLWKGIKNSWSTRVLYTSPRKELHMAVAISILGFSAHGLFESELAQYHFLFMLASVLGFSAWLGNQGGKQ